MEGFICLSSQLYDTTNDYGVSFIASGILFTIGGLLSIFGSKFCTERCRSGAVNHTELLQQIRPAVFIICLLAAILGALANGFVIYVFLRSKALQNQSIKTPMKAVVHLALTDLITIVLFGYGIIILQLDIKVNHVCLFNSTVTLYMIFVTQFVLLVTNFDRYISICHQQKYSKILRKPFLDILFALAWLLPLPLHIFPLCDYTILSKTQHCIPMNLYPKWFLLTQSFFFFFIMTSTVSLFIPILAKAVEFHRKTVPAHFYGVNARTALAKGKRRAIRNSFFIGVLTFVFMVCNLPFSIIRMQVGLGFVWSNAVLVVTLTLGIMNGVFNPFIYAFQKQLFRKEAIKYIPCKCFKRDSEARQLSRENKLTRKKVSIPPTHINMSRNNALQDVSQNAEVEIGKLHANNKSMPKARPKIIYVQPYQEANIAETSL